MVPMQLFVVWLLLSPALLVRLFVLMRVRVRVVVVVIAVVITSGFYAGVVVSITVAWFCVIVDYGDAGCCD